MAIRHYLAMTPSEVRANPHLPPNIAWLGCHFSPYCTHASNLPKRLPPGSAIILDDVTPIAGHDPERIAAQLTACVQALKADAVLLDLQRPGCEETAALAAVLTQRMPCPVGVSSLYARELSCPVLLPPAPCHISLEDHLAPWQGREIWLETALEAQTIRLTEAGAAVRPLPRDACPEDGFPEEALLCHYRAELEPDAAVFTLWRTPEDLVRLLSRAEELGVTRCFGLYQELGSALAEG